jgi:hypothetical protein
MGSSTDEKLLKNAELRGARNYKDESGRLKAETAPKAVFSFQFS